MYQACFVRFAVLVRLVKDFVFSQLVYYLGKQFYLADKMRTVLHCIYATLGITMHDVNAV